MASIDGDEDGGAGGERGEGDAVDDKNSVEVEIESALSRETHDVHEVSLLVCEIK